MKPLQANETLDTFFKRIQLEHYTNLGDIFKLAEI